MFIVFEGIDGSGKTTQLRLLQEKLQCFDVPVLVTREPGGTAIGENIRKILLDPSCKMQDMTEAMLYVAARAQFISEVVAPALRDGKIVLSDRFALSTIAYQGYGRGLDVAQLNSLNKMAVGRIKPDITFIFDLDPEIAMQRIGGDKDRLEQESLLFFNQVRKGYIMEAGRAPETHIVLSAHQHPDRLAEQVFCQLHPLLSLEECSCAVQA